MRYDAAIGWCGKRVRISRSDAVWQICFAKLRMRSTVALPIPDLRIRSVCHV